MPEMQAYDRPWPRRAEHGGYDRVRPGIGVVERVHVVGHAGLVASLAGLPLDQWRRILGLRWPEPAANRSGQGVQPPRASRDLRVGARGVHGLDVQVVHGVIAQVVATVQDPPRDLRVLPEPGPYGEHRDLRSRPFRLGEQRVSQRYRSLTVEGERHLGPVSWPVHDLRAELRARATGRAHRRGRHRSGWPGTRAAGGRADLPHAGAPRQSGPVRAAPDRSKNFRRSIGTCRTVPPAPGRSHRPPGLPGGRSAGSGLAVVHGGWLAVPKPQRGAGERCDRYGHGRHDEPGDASCARWRWMCDGGEAGWRRCLWAWSRPNAELGKGAGQLGTGPEPSGGLQWLSEAVLAWWRVDDRPADRTRVEVLADLPELLAWRRGNARHCVDDRVPRAEGGRRRRDGQLGRCLGGQASVRTEQHGEQAGLPGERGEAALLSWLTLAGDDDRVDQPGADDARLGRSLRCRRRGQRD